MPSSEERLSKVEAEIAAQVAEVKRLKIKCEALNEIWQNAVSSSQESKAKATLEYAVLLLKAEQEKEAQLRGVLKVLLKGKLDLPGAL